MGRILCIILGLVACIFTATVHGEEQVVRAVVGDDGVQRAELIGGSYFFKPNHLVVKVRMPVELKVKKEPGMVPHTIVMKALDAGIDFSVELGTEPRSIAFTPMKTGSYQFYCDKKLPFFDSHREKGMYGVLEVVD